MAIEFRGIHALKFSDACFLSSCMLNTNGRFEHTSFLAEVVDDKARRRISRSKSKGVKGRVAQLISNQSSAPVFFPTSIREPRTCRDFSNY